jgi:putative transposase
VEDEVEGRSLLDEIAREGARRMLVAALETEVATYVETHRNERDGDGHALSIAATPTLDDRSLLD